MNRTANYAKCKMTGMSFNEGKPDGLETRKSPRWAPAMAAALAVLTILFAASCARRAAEANPAPTSSSTAGSDPSRAGLFSVPQEQMGHVQVVTIAPTRLRRVLRLPGTVAYNFFETTPVIAQISGPVSQDPDRAGRECPCRAADAVRGESRLCPAPHQLSEGERRVRPGAEELRAVARTCTSIA